MSSTDPTVPLKARIKKLIPWIAGLSFIAYVVVVGYQLIINRPERLDSAASKLLQAAIDNDASTYASYLTFEEQDINNLTEESMENILKNVVLPVIGQHQTVDSEVTAQLATYTGNSEYAIVDKDGTVSTLHVATFEHHDQLKTLFSPLVLGAWVADYRSTFDVPFNKETLTLAMLRGLRKDRKTLESYGFVEMFRYDSVTRKIERYSLEAIEVHYEREWGDLLDAKEETLLLNQKSD